MSKPTFDGPPVRLLDDPAAGAELKAELSALGDSAVPFDLDGGLEAFQDSLAAEPPASEANAPSGDSPPTDPVTPGTDAAASAVGAAGHPVLIAAGAAGIIGLGLFAYATSRAPAVTPPAERGVPAASSSTAPDVAPTPSLAKPVETPAPLPEPSASAATEPRASSSVTVRPSAAPPPSAKPTLADEIQHLRSLRQLAAANPGAAAVKATQGHAKFRGGMLYQEREAIAITSLARAGQSGAARVRAKRFLATFPKSPFAAQVRQATRLEK